MILFTGARQAISVPKVPKQKNPANSDRVFMLLTNQKTINYENLFQTRETTPPFAGAKVTRS
jgi:hypothetical protein